MKKITFNKNSCVIIVSILTSFVFFSSCKKEEKNEAPLINSIRAISPSPNDSTLTRVLPDQLVVIQGKNLSSAISVTFNGVKASFNSALVGDNNFVIRVPIVDFSSVRPEDQNVIKIITKYGAATYNFPVLPPPAAITYIENENTLPGNVMVINGIGLYANSVVFPGNLQGSNIKVNGTGTRLEVTVPADLTISGKVKVITASSTATSIADVNYVDGPRILVNFDGKNNNPTPENNANILAPVENDATLFPGNRGNYSHFKTGPIGQNDFGYRNKRSIWTFPQDWIPTENLQDTLGNWAIKFEIFAKEFDNATLLIVKDPGSYDRCHRFEPWNTTLAQPGTKTIYPDYQKGKWVTITIPFDQFFNKANNVDGTGIPAVDMFNFLEVDQFSNTTPKGKLNELLKMLLVTPPNKATNGVDFAIDNVRTARIK